MRRLFFIFAPLFLIADALVAQPGTRTREPVHPAAPVDREAITDMEKPFDTSNEAMLALTEELQSLSYRLASLEEQARQSSEVKEALHEYADALKEEMLQRSPAQEALIGRYHTLMVEILNFGNRGSLSETEREDLARKLEEHQQLRQELVGVRSEARQVESVEQKIEAAREVQMEKMKKLDPQFTELLKKRARLTRQLAEVREQVTSPGRARNGD